MRVFIILFVLLFSNPGFSQNETMAEFPGGQPEMAKFIQENIHIPGQAYKRKVDGKCYIRFVVTEYGNISNVVVQLGVENCPACDKEAVRVVKSMPGWIPGTINGKPINTWFTLPIVFKVV